MKSKTILGMVIVLFLINMVSQYSASAQEKFTLKDIKIEQVMAKTDIVITGEGGKIRTEGSIGTIPNKQFPGETILLERVVHNGAIHRFKGTVNGTALDRMSQFRDSGFTGYVFEGDETDPLTFRCTYGKGYVYVGGKGSVTLKDGKRVALGGSSASSPHSAAQGASFSAKESRMTDVLNEYLLLTVFAANIDHPELVQIVKPIFDKHRLPFEALKGGTENLQDHELSLGLAAGSRYWVVTFGSKWADFLGLWIDSRGDFPAISFRNGSVSLGNGDPPPMRISDGMQAKVSEQVWEYEPGKWVLKGTP
ncbi:MAG: hypothetical protein NT096_09005 [Proteobacteria bacterium]|nr:hypothetical protein [Pseudomonadota bacterium]